jgi:predicted PurR-regulated permease PerM
MDKRWFHSKKFLALVLVLAVVLIIAVLGICFHQQITDLVTRIIAFASTHQLAQGTQDAIAKYKGTAGEAVQKAKNFLQDDPSPTDQTDVQPPLCPM